MASANQRTGRVYLTINGTYYESDGGAKLSNANAMTREDVIGDQIHGFKEVLKAPTLECSLIHGGDLDVLAVGDIVDGTVIFRTDTDISYTLSNCWVSELKDLDGKEGKLGVTIKSKLPAQSS